MKNTIIAIIAFILTVLFCIFTYWCGGGDFARGPKLQDLCVVSFALGLVISFGAFAIFNFIDE